MNECKHLLPCVDKYYKANLHTHSTISDGKLSPAEVKDAYKNLGYQILCLTDHNVTVNHSDLNDPDFLMLTGVEINVNDIDCHQSIRKRTYHLNLISKTPDNLWSPGTVQNKHPGAAPYEGKMQCEGMDLRYLPDSINAMIAKANEKGFLVIYNHPTWSCQTYPDYAPLKGLWGMEMRNTECYLLGHNENNFRVYKDLLTLGNQVFPLGTDDMHGPRALGQSWIMVGAKELTYESVIEALEKGDFYMSCGPEITGITLQGTTIKINCSNAQSVQMESYGRLAGLITAKDEPIREVEFSLEKIIEKSEGAPEVFVYFTITAPDGTYAVTRPYYLKDLK